MSHSYAQNHVHLVFGTKERQRLIAKAMQRRLRSYIAGICKGYDMLVFAIGGLDGSRPCSVFGSRPSSHWHAL